MDRTLHDPVRPESQAGLVDDPVQFSEQLVQRDRLGQRLAEIPKRVRGRDRSKSTIEAEGPSGSPSVDISSRRFSTSQKSGCSNLQCRQSLRILPAHQTQGVFGGVHSLVGQAVRAGQNDTRPLDQSVWH